LQKQARKKFELGGQGKKSEISEEFRETLEMK
jgi:hypothetical protein